MKIEDKNALLVIYIQQEDFVGMKEDDTENPAYICIRNAKKVLDVFRAKRLPVIQIKEVHRKDFKAATLPGVAAFPMLRLMRDKSAPV